jgi:hypothetical protein
MVRLSSAGESVKSLQPQRQARPGARHKINAMNKFLILYK